jgi:hypothetical protein
MHDVGRTDASTKANKTASYYSTPDGKLKNLQLKKIILLCKLNHEVVSVKIS